MRSVEAAGVEVDTTGVGDGRRTTGSGGLGAIPPENGWVNG